MAVENARGIVGGVALLAACWLGWQAAEAHWEAQAIDHQVHAARAVRDDRTASLNTTADAAGAVLALGREAATLRGRRNSTGGIAVVAGLAGAVLLAGGGRPQRP